MKSETFQEQLDRAKAILDQLMDPEKTLEESLKLFEEGIKTVAEAQKMIEEAKLKVKTIAQEQHGEEA